MNDVQPKATAIRPLLHRVTDVLGAIIAPNRDRLAAPFDDLIQRAHDALRRKGQVNLDAQRLAIVIVEHVEQPEAAPIAQRIMHEVHRPHLINSFGHGEWLRRLPYESATRSDTQVELQRAMKPIDPFVVPRKVPDIPQR